MHSFLLLLLLHISVTYFTSKAKYQIPLNTSIHIHEEVCHWDEVGKLLNNVLRRYHFLHHSLPKLSVINRDLNPSHLTGANSFPTKPCFVTTILIKPCETVNHLTAKQREVKMLNRVIAWGLACYRITLYCANIALSGKPVDY